MTELEAVNVLLAIVGETPIESFATESTNEVSDSALARRTLHEVARDIMAEGCWTWRAAMMRSPPFWAMRSGISWRAIRLSGSAIS